ncbi:MAG: endolytic transglycosylase MltG [Maricaulis sp.]|uniref:endolytic transglycosylase MltG n=1 Tax=Maricaulis sp. TaxID=1486257 RepID=UPI001B2276B3|nr:endolytic transglycosylase MltG [Maricaulis sp.]MBO6728304.1 endolytic transglycosylase MltG [Maricaulis sp.]MBO6847877.1 endolytic transglycosylase MltG [Maricaulis sp.]MBO6877500.1 endolytic transglycosylase MltG [Maricaulis sp.]
MGEVDARKPAPLWMKLLIWGGVALVVLALLAAGGMYAGYRWMQDEFAAPGPTAEATVTTLPRGAGLIRIASQLENEGLISDARIFRFAVTLDEGDRSLRAGEYEIPAGASMAQIYELLRSGQTVQHPVTLAEGLTSAMIVRSLAEEAVLTGDISETPAEGALLPETYLVTRGTSRQEIIERMARAQDELLDALWDQRAENLPFETREEAIILASIVEKETGIGGERGEVAGVFVNRLRRGMRLESDPTIIYGISQGEPLGRGLRRSEIDNPNNAWNTYQIPALPPTPIANPGREAIAAVLNPTETSALFFVADGTGGHVFADTYAEHQQNVRRWRQIERQRRQAGN